MTQYIGNLVKMGVRECTSVEYSLRFNDGQEIPLNRHIGQSIELKFTGLINCVNCHRQIKKSYNQGYCFPCMQKLAACDMCIIKPELCHYHQGTCREPNWGEQHCMQSHIVYLANSSGLKVGITRQPQVPTRWLDQGAIQALPLFRVSSRLLSGLLEVIFAKHISDKTNWRKMLQGNIPLLDLQAEKDRLLTVSEESLSPFLQQQSSHAIETLNEATESRFEYPVIQYPEKIKSLNFDKTQDIAGTLMGVKGQYLLLDSDRVLNIRKFTAYQVEVKL